MLTIDRYNARLGAGPGLLDETRLLLELWHERMSVAELIDAARNSGSFASISARRLRNIISERFSTRHLTADGAPATLLKHVLAEDMPIVFWHLCFVFTCRAHRILADFVTQVYWPPYAAGKDMISNEESLEFVRRINNDGLTTIDWSESIQRRVASYSRNLKVAALERRLQNDGRFDEFKKRIQKDLDLDWSEVQNDPLALDSVIPELAHDFYPALFKSPGAFSTSTSEFITFENERVKEMIEIARQHSGKQYIIFVVDEMGQYVAPSDSLILNVDGLAKNLKALGEGKVWMIATAQQMLTEDDPRAAANSKSLFKLKDRFPIQIDLESSDIREICSQRLLGKSAAGTTVLKKLFEQHGQKLRNCTKLQDAKYYDSDFTDSVFADLYPFLPAHFTVE